mmetsp:Transcript_112732/g.358186  ORF Transcript_112732/g.358186 Transcript_112732/m.358186 type:complete len:203 (-) Transcript_112732:174-782(-)
MPALPSRRRQGVRTHFKLFQLLLLTATLLLDLHIHNVPPNAEPLTPISLNHLMTTRLGVLLDLILGLQTRPSISLLSGLLHDLPLTLPQDVLLVVVLADRLVLDLYLANTARRTIFFLSVSRAPPLRLFTNRLPPMWWPSRGLSLVRFFSSRGRPDLASRLRACSFSLEPRCSTFCSLLALRLVLDLRIVAGDDGLLPPGEI